MSLLNEDGTINTSSPEYLAMTEAAGKGHIPQQPEPTSSDQDTDPPYVLFRAIFVERLHAAEAEQLEAVLQGSKPKLRMMYNAVEYFLSDDPLFAVLHWTLGEALGFDRADDLLARP